MMYHNRISARISTHALREEGDRDHGAGWGRRRISTHALREEGDRPRRPTPRGYPGFLPTPSARRATLSGVFGRAGAAISTHALREEGDTETSLNSVHSAISTHALREEGD